MLEITDTEAGRALRWTELPSLPSKASETQIWSLNSSTSDSLAGKHEIK